MTVQRSRPKALEWDKEGDGIRQIRASDELPSGVTLSTPTAAVQMKTRNSEPEDWNTVAEITVSLVTVVDAVADNGVDVLGTNQAVQFQLDADPDTLPDETDLPIPGAEYRVVVKADRSDGGDWVGKVPLIIHF